MKTAQRRLAPVLIEIWLPVAIVAVSWVVSSRFTSLYFPPLSRIWADMRQVLTHNFASDIVPSLQNFALGLAIAVFLGVGLGLALGLNDGLYRALQPILEFMRAIPGVAILPVMLVIFGLGTSMKIAVIAFGALWPVLLNTVDGVRGVDRLILDVGRCYRIGGWHALSRIILPSASPQIIAGVRISVSLGVILIVASEYIASTEGIGYLELQSARQYQMGVMWATLLLLGVLGYLANVSFRLVENRLLRWHRGLRGNTQGDK
jgi:ABC-type nitrate/sulfonate/bicarbonate transport system permease component